MVNLLWAFSTLNFQDMKFITLFRLFCTRQLAEFSVQNSTNTVWGLAHLGVLDPPLSEHLAA